ncbi:MAG TPA: prolyl oligopeptidase family serine peptidase, partial [Bryobacteraceae bacterium]|nr:prolyl oligopeptidase family serine peptidase [Bryobacteraceae bacterium]
GFVAGLVFTAVVFGQANNKPLPAPGIAVPEADQKQMKVGLDRLSAKLEAIRGNPLYPDVLVFHKAVRFALEGHEFFRAEQIFRAKELLRVGSERADQLARGEAPWTHRPGLTVRGYISRIDGSVQPYGLVLPPSFGPDKPHHWRLDTWFHGRSETLNEIDFVYDRLQNAGEFQPADTITLHLYGRYCNASKFAGEVDLFEALEDVKKHYEIDENRVLLRGFSMGGASVWHLAAHSGSGFAAAQPGAGFVETLEYQKASKYEPTWWEQKLYHLTNAADYAGNFFNLPVVAYNGDQDPQRQAADIMERNMAAEGLTLQRIWGQKIGHAFTPLAKVQISEAIDAIAAKGRVEWPRQVKFTTWTLKYNRMRWVVVDGLEKHWERARVDADVEGDHTVRVKTANVSGVSFEMSPAAGLLSVASKVTVNIDGQSLTLPGALSDGSWTVRLRKVSGKWVVGGGDVGLMKKHGLQGPIDDAFMDSFVMVRGTGTAMNEAVGKWAKSEQDRAIQQWRGLFRGDTPVKDDTGVTDADIAASNLVLWGDPESNKVLARIAGKLPVQWTREAVVVGGRKYPAATNVPVLIYPNPLNPAKYVVINSGFTFRESANGSNSWQVAELPDYAVIDISQPADKRWPGKVALAGFFGEKWELLANDGK